MTSTTRTAIVLTRDERRCVRRCLDNLVDAEFDEILVVDTGSTDATTDIVGEYTERGVRLMSVAWPGSFSCARNIALDHAMPGWVMFVDADEWPGPDSAVRRFFDELDARDDATTAAFAPTIKDVDRTSYVDDVGRIFRTDSGIRYHGHVHEYPAIAGTGGRAAEVVPIPFVLLHDGYSPGVMDHRSKMDRNVALLTEDVRAEPGNPRWTYFLLRDSLPALGARRIVELCAELRKLTENAGNVTGYGPEYTRDYYRRALRLAGYGLVSRGQRGMLDRLCDEMDEMDTADGASSPDPEYFRLMMKVVDDATGGQDLQRLIGIRGDTGRIANSLIASDGRHVDALLAVLLERERDAETARRYRELCTPWNDSFFAASRLHTR